MTKAFKTTKNWLEGLKNDEDANNYLADHSIKWQFNLSKPLVGEAFVND